MFIDVIHRFEDHYNRISSIIIIILFMLVIISPEADPKSIALIFILMAVLNLKGFEV